MTKLEILQHYSTRRVRDSWAALGSLEATNTTRAYVKDQIYQINTIGSSLHQSLVFCTQEPNVVQDWTIALPGNLEYGEIEFKPGITSPHFFLLITGEEFTSIIEDIDDSFIPYQEDLVSSSKIKIPEEELNVILTDLGVPFIRVDELEYNRQEITDLMITPALQEYFKWFPKVLIMTYPVKTANTVEYEFPTGAYDVVHVGVTQGFGGGAHNVLLRYFDEVVWNSQSPIMGHTGGRRAPKHVSTDWGAMMMDRAVRQGLINYGTRVHHQIIKKSDGKKYLSAYGNKLGTLQVHYAMQTISWEDVEFARLPELRELCRANVLRAFGALRAQAKADIPGAVDYSQWVSKAEELRNKVITEWKDLVKFSGILRGSM